MKRKRKKPTSSLRDRLQSYDTRKVKSYFKDINDRSFKDNLNIDWLMLPVSIFQSMHRHIFTKILIGLIVILLVMITNVFNLPFADNVYQAIQHTVSTDWNIASIEDNIMPVVQDIRSGNFLATGEGEDEDLKEETVMRNDVQPSVSAVKPVQGDVISSYGMRENTESQTQEMHYGIDILAPNGTEVKATLGGEVISVEEHSLYGLAIIINHEDINLTTVYARLGQALVEVGETVVTGQNIGVMGAATPSGSHLHFEVWQNDSPVNPKEIFSFD